MKYTLIVVGVIVLLLFISYLIARIIYGAFGVRDKNYIKTEEKWLKKYEKRGKSAISKAYRDGKDYIDGIPCKSVKIKSYDGLELYGKLYDRKSDVTVMLLHGFHSIGSRDFAVSFPYFYDELSYNVFIPDMRAHGDSEGKYITFGVFESEDIIRWTKALENEYKDGCKIIYYGISMGAASAITAAASADVPHSLCGVISESVYASFLDVVRSFFLRKYHFSLLFTEPYLWGICLKKSKADLMKAEIETLIPRVEVPVLFIHGSDDKLVNKAHSVKIFDKCRSEKDMLLVDGAGHGTSFAVSPEKCKAQIGLFLSKCF